MHTRNPRSWEVEAGRSAVQGHAWLPGKFEVGLAYLKLFLEKMKGRRRESRRGREGETEERERERASQPVETTLWSKCP